jgi:hypothetical protein
LAKKLLDFCGNWLKKKNFKKISKIFLAFGFPKRIFEAEAGE